MGVKESESAEEESTIGVFEGFQQPVPQFLFAGIFVQEEDVVTCMRCRQAVTVAKSYS